MPLSTSSAIHARINAYAASSSPARAAAYSRDGGGSRSLISVLLSGIPNLTASVSRHPDHEMKPECLRSKTWSDLLQLSLQGFSKAHLRRAGPDGSGREQPGRARAVERKER